MRLLRPILLALGLLLTAFATPRGAHAEEELQRRVDTLSSRIREAVAVADAVANQHTIDLPAARRVAWERWLLARAPAVRTARDARRLTTNRTRSTRHLLDVVRMVGPLGFSGATYVVPAARRRLAAMGEALPESDALPPPAAQAWELGPTLEALAWQPVAVTSYGVFDDEGAPVEARYASYVALDAQHVRASREREATAALSLHDGPYRPFDMPARSSAYPPNDAHAPTPSTHDSATARSSKPPDPPASYRPFGDDDGAYRPFDTWASDMEGEVDEPRLESQRPCPSEGYRAFTDEPTCLPDEDPLPAVSAEAPPAVSIACDAAWSELSGAVSEHCGAPRDYLPFDAPQRPRLRPTRDVFASPLLHPKLLSVRDVALEWDGHDVTLLSSQPVLATALEWAGVGVVDLRPAASPVRPFAPPALAERIVIALFDVTETSAGGLAPMVKAFCAEASDCTLYRVGVGGVPEQALVFLHVAPSDEASTLPIEAWLYGVRQSVGVRP